MATVPGSAGRSRSSMTTPHAASGDARDRSPDWEYGDLSWPAPSQRVDERCDVDIAGAGRLLLLGGRRGLGFEVVVGPVDGALDQLAEKRAVDDDRPALCELDQRAGCARLGRRLSR
jgi:hypothetical protein